METLKSLIIRFRQSGILFLVGIILIVYIGFGFVYLQQGAQQSDFVEKINKLSVILARPLASAEELQAEYEKVNISLALKADQEAIADIVSIAEESGIDVSQASSKFSVPRVGLSNVKVGGGTYRILSFRGIHVRGDYDSVMAFISDLDSGKTLGNLVLTKVVFNQVVVSVTGEEGVRRAEFSQVTAAVNDMMADNGLSRIPRPMSYIGGLATNFMGDDPSTAGTVEGFPDILTTPDRKGYTGTGSPRGGYVLYNHDKVSTDSTSQFETVSYIAVPTTKYYYTCEANGTVRQFDKAGLSTAEEYTEIEASRIEIDASVDVNIYTKP